MFFIVVTVILFGQAKNRDEQVCIKASDTEYPNRPAIGPVDSLDNGISIGIAAAHSTNSR
jgi:hypothetical protein